jgi:LmbE family N-acetylglucosaminyl deacetylase
VVMAERKVAGGRWSVVSCRRPASFLYFALLSALCIFASTRAALADEPAPVDILIIAPHSDDEAIGGAALMLRALAKSEHVAIVVVTAGDGFPKAASAAARKPIAELKPADFDALAELRQRHTLQAMTSLGLAPTDVLFLGYPDGGLRTMFDAAADAPPYKQPHTTRTATYGIVRPDYHSTQHGRAAPYTKASVVADLTEIIRSRGPKAIFTTLDIDTHPDHRATSLFVREAARATNYKGPVRGYAVHGKPPADEPDLTLTLTPEELKRKRALLEIYQVGVSPVHDGLADEYTQPEERFWLLPADSVK